MDETMLQRLARTLYEITRANGDRRPDEASRSLAVQLLKAMRDPTENMALAGGEALPGDESPFTPKSQKDVWRAMIEDAFVGRRWLIRSKVHLIFTRDKLKFRANAQCRYSMTNDFAYLLP